MYSMAYQCNGIFLISGGHFWFPLSSKTKLIDKDTIKLLKYSSWTTSAGHADWYTVQAVSPEFDGDFSNLSCFLIFKVKFAVFY